MVRSEATADDSFAEILARRRLGMAIAATIRMMATTISSSIKEKPRSSPCLWFACPGFGVLLMVFDRSWHCSKNKGGSETSSLVRGLARKLVADRTRYARSCHDGSASTLPYADRRSTVGDELDHARLVIAERAHTSRLVRGRRGVHFEAVEHAVNVRKGSSRIEHIAALDETTSAQKRVNETPLHCSGDGAWRCAAEP